jgi:4-diphosphocytidyl-2-C-methyl-D-erythritol kinase
MKSSTDSIRTRVYAKVNLALSVGGVIRASGENNDGLHPICSWMHAINLCDEIEIHRLRSDEDSNYAVGWAICGSPDLPADWDLDRDLAARMHRVVEDHIGEKLPVSMRVSKSIPAGGGLGGGSADAAGVLLGLNELFGLDLDYTELVQIAIKLGSDIPFFIDPEHTIPRPAVVEGIGDQITRLGRVHEGTPITLFFPQFGCHTGEVYQAFDVLIDNDPKHTLQTDRIKEISSRSLITSHDLFNDLATPAAKVAPALGDILEMIHQSVGKPVHVSGSGSTLYVIGGIESELTLDPQGRYSVVSTHLC